MSVRAVGPAAGAAPQPDGARSPALEVGARVEGRVERLAGGRAEVALIGFGRASADLPAGLSVGSTFQAIVEAVGDPIRLRLIAENPSGPFALLRRAFRAEASDAPALASLLKRALDNPKEFPLLARWALRSDAPPDGAALRRLLSTLAEPMEARLHAAALRGGPLPEGTGDLHAELRAAERALLKAADGSPEGQRALAEVRALLREAEAAQILNAASQAAGTGLLVGFPFLLDGEEGFLHLRIQPEEEEDEDAPAGAARFDVRVELSRLGAVRATGLLGPGALRARLSVENAAGAELLRAASGELEDALGRVGFPGSRIEVGEEPVPSRAAWTAASLPGRAAMVDVRA